MGAVKKHTLIILFFIKKAKLQKSVEVLVCIRIAVNRRIAEVMIKRNIPVDL